MARWRRADLDAAHLPRFAGRAVATKRSASSRANSVNRDDKDGRPPDDADLVVRALALLEGFAAYPVCVPTAERLPAAGTLSQDATSPTALRTAATGDRARPSGPTGQGKPQPKSYSAPRATGHRSTGPAAPAHRRPRGAACRAIGAARPKRALSAAASNAAPTTERRRTSTQYRRKSLSLPGYSAQFWKPFSYCNNICQQRRCSANQRETAISSSTIGPPPTGNAMYCLPPAI